MIRHNAHKYSVSAIFSSSSNRRAHMCDVLNVKRSTYYYQLNRCKNEVKKAEDVALSNEIERIFKMSRNNDGTRKELVKLTEPKQVSRRRIGRLMRKRGMVSNYTVAQFKPHPSSCNEATVKNVLKRNFNQQEALAVIVSDLTYVRVNGKWHYVCLFVDLFNREIIGYSAGKNKTASLVYKALASIQRNLNEIQLFHTNRGKEFDNQLIDEALETFTIQRSLSMKGCPYDNAVAEATFKVFKTEFANQLQFSSLEHLELTDYVHWFNHIRMVAFQLQPS